MSSQPLLNEFARSSTGSSASAVDVRSAFRLFAETFTLVTPDALGPPTCRDRDDDAVLATALAGECAPIVTGDQDPLTLDPFRHIRVLAPSAFGKMEI
jgi:predicted nucleic acid-binding protein